MKKLSIYAFAFVLLSVVSGCQNIPKKATAVSPFDLNKYLGKWYEIARIDFKFERNLDHTTANYSLRDDGKVKVVNQGYDTVKKVDKESVGKAKFRGSDNVGELKVSFFGPFYSGYNVIALEGNYEYALVAGRNTDYLWILSRYKTIPEEVKNRFLDQAKSIGYDTSRLLWIEQD